MKRIDGIAIEGMLRDLRPVPAPDFAAGLYTWAATGRPPRSLDLRLSVARLRERLRVPPPRRLVYAGGAMAVIAIADAAALGVGTESGNPTRTAVDRSEGGALLNEFSGASAGESQAASPSSGRAISGRAIERSAQITLFADPGDVADDSSEVFAAVHDAHGVVLRSSTTRGAA